MKFKMVRYRTIYLYILSLFTLFILLFGKFLLESSGFPQFLYAPLVLTVCVIWLANLLYNPKYIKVSNDAVTIRKGWFNRTHFLLNDINNVELVYSFSYNNPLTENGFERIPIYYAPYFSERHTAEGKSHLTKLKVVRYNWLH